MLMARFTTEWAKRVNSKYVVNSSRNDIFLKKEDAGERTKRCRNGKSPEAIATDHPALEAGYHIPRYKNVLGFIF